MDDHEYAMRDALESALARINPTDDELREEYPDDDRDALELREDHDMTSVLSIDVEHVVDVMLTVGGPTCFFRVWCDAGWEPYRVEYHDSWAHPVQMVSLSGEEMGRVLETIGPFIDENKYAAR